MSANALGIFEGPNLTVYNPTGGTLAKYSRVKVTAAEVNGCPSIGLCAAVDPCLAILQEDIPTLKFGNARFENAAGTQLYIANEAIAAGAKIYGAASGKVTDTSAVAATVGQAISPAAADGDIIKAVWSPDAGLAANA